MTATSPPSPSRHARRLGIAAVCIGALALTGTSTLAFAGGSRPAESTAAASVVGLREGDSGATVQAVQQKLIGFGYYVAGGADGHFGPGTTAALPRVPAAERSQSDRGRHREHGALSRTRRRCASRWDAGGSRSQRPQPPSLPHRGRLSVSAKGRPEPPFGSCNSPFSPRGCTSTVAQTARLGHPLTAG